MSDMDAPLLAAGGLFAAIILFAIAFTSGDRERAQVRESLRLLGVADDDRRSALSTLLSTRITTPLIKSAASLGHRFAPVGYLDSTRKKLTAAGRPTAEDMEHFLVLRSVSIIAIPITALAFVVFSVAGLEGTTGLAVVALVAVACLLGPEASLNRQVEERAKQIRIKLPDILDLLTISVEAGLGFEQALDRTAVAVPGPLSEEFIRMIGEVRAGVRRSDAMQAMAERVDVAELRSFVLAILQADTFGVSIGRGLRAQADEARVKRRQQVEEQAQKAPVKMLVPMVFCIFPALLVVVIGPAAVNISRAL